MTRGIDTAMPWRRTILSTLTAAWLVFQIVTVVSLEDRAWPVTEMRFFGGSATEDIDLRLTGVGPEGQPVAMTAEGFGLLDHQLQAWLAESLAARENTPLARLAAIWNVRNPADPVAVVQLWGEREQLPAGEHERISELLVVWDAP